MYSRERKNSSIVVCFLFVVRRAFVGFFDLSFWHTLLSLATILPRSFCVAKEYSVLRLPLRGSCAKRKRLLYQPDILADWLQIGWQFIFASWIFQCSRWVQTPTHSHEASTRRLGRFFLVSPFCFANLYHACVRGIYIHFVFLLLYWRQARPGSWLICPYTFFFLFFLFSLVFLYLDSSLCVVIPVVHVIGWREKRRACVRTVLSRER